MRIRYISISKYYYPHDKYVFTADGACRDSDILNAILSFYTPPPSYNVTFSYTHPNMGTCDEYYFCSETSTQPDFVLDDGRTSLSTDWIGR